MLVEKQTYKNTRVLLVDDDTSILNLISSQMGSRGYVCETAADGENAIEICQKKTFNIIVTGVFMPKIDGLKLLDYVKQHWPYMAVIIITGNSENNTLKKSAKLGAVYYMPKPINFEELGDIMSIATLYSMGKLMHTIAKTYMDLRHMAVQNQAHRLQMIKSELKRILSLRMDTSLFNDFLDKNMLNAAHNCELTAILDIKFMA